MRKGLYLDLSLNPLFQIDVYIEEGKHEQDKLISKQLNDKERYIAAMENDHLAGKTQLP